MEKNVAPCNDNQIYFYVFFTLNIAPFDKVKGGKLEINNCTPMLFWTLEYGKVPQFNNVTSYSWTRDKFHRSIEVRNTNLIIFPFLHVSMCLTTKASPLELNYLGVIAQIFGQIRGHNRWFELLFAPFEDFSSYLWLKV